MERLPCIELAALGNSVIVSALLTAGANVHIITWEGGCCK